MASSRPCIPRWPRAPSRHSHPDTVASGVMKHTMSQHSVPFLVWVLGLLATLWEVSAISSLQTQCDGAGARRYQLLLNCFVHSFQCAGEATLVQQVLPSCSHGRFDRMDSKLVCPKPGWLLSSLPFLEDACTTYWGGRRPVDSITLENAGLSQQLLKEPGGGGSYLSCWTWRWVGGIQSSGSEAHGRRILTSSQTRQLCSPLGSPWPISLCFLFNMYVYVLKPSKTLKMRD